MTQFTIKHFSLLLCLACGLGVVGAQGTATNKGDLLFTEDFSAFTAGSEDSPSTIDLTDHYTGVIDAGMTQYPGWSGAGVYAAGGSCYVGAFTDPYYGETIDGYLNAPHNDYSGDITFKFRAKRQGTGATKIHFTVASGSTSLGGFTGDLTNEWQEYSGTFSVTDVKAKTSIIQFSSEEGVTFFVDDIEVYRKKGQILPPDALPYTDATATSFKANWRRHSEAQGYLLSVYTKNPNPANDEVAENFDNPVSTDLKQTLASGVQLDLTAGTGAAFTTQECSTQPNAVLLDATGDAITTPTKADRPLKWVKFWAKPHVSAGPTGKIVLKCQVANEWQEIGTIDISHFAGGQQVLLQSQLPAGAQALQLVLERGNSDLSIDNLISGFDPEKEFVFQDKELSETSYLVGGIDLGKHDYFYAVKAKNGEDVSGASKEQRVDFLPAPQVQEAADVTTHSFRPQWTFPEKAQGGILYNYIKHTAPSSETAVLVSDSFDKVAGKGTVDNPQLLPEDEKILDAYTLQPGWLGSKVALADGMIGAKGWGGSVQLPTMTLNNAQGKYTVEVTAHCTKANTDLSVKSISGEDVQKQTMAFTQAGELSKTLEFTNGSLNTVLTFSTTAGEPFFINAVAVKQQLEPGDSYRMLTHNNVLIDVPADGSSPCYIVLDNLSEGEVYEYNVLAYTHDNDDITLSELSDFQEVKLLQSPSSIGATEVQGGEAFKVLAHATLQVMKSGQVAVFDTVGHCVLSGEVKAGAVLPLNLPAGIYIVKHSSGSCRKLLLP